MDIPYTNAYYKPSMDLTAHAVIIAMCDRNSPNRFGFVHSLNFS